MSDKSTPLVRGKEASLAKKKTRNFKLPEQKMQ
jgi:hypothetical protein